MLLLALPFVFGPLRSVSIGYRILTGTLLGIAFHLINQTIGFMGLVYHLPPLLSAFLPALLLLATVVVLLRRVR
jgi:lipopolysaccharide export system permease protein